MTRVLRAIAWAWVVASSLWSAFCLLDAFRTWRAYRRWRALVFRGVREAAEIPTILARTLHEIREQNERMPGSPDGRDVLPSADEEPAEKGEGCEDDGRPPLP